MTGTTVGDTTCSGQGTTILHDNQYFTPTGAVTECNVPLAQWQQQGGDKGSTVALVPDDDTIIGWAKAVLNSR